MSNQQFYGAGGPPQPPFQQQGYPQQGFPPEQQGFHPQQQGFPPQQQNFRGYNQGLPPQGHPQQFQNQGFPPQQQGFGGPTQQYGPPPPMPSPGYDPRSTAVGNASADASALRSAMKGFGTDEATLIRVLSKPDPLQMALLRNTYSQQIGRNLEKDVDKETSGHFREALLAIIRGPLMQDVHNVQQAIKGFGTKESVLNDVLLGRSNADMHAIKTAYHSTYKHTLDADVKGDLSMKTERLFGIVMQATRAEESAPIITSDIDRDCSDLHRATDGRVGTDQMQVCSILASRSDGQIRAIAQMYQQRYHLSLEENIRKEFSGHMQDALLLMLRRATDRAMCDAVALEETMAGMGTKDSLLCNRVVRIHWDRMAMDQVKRAYQHRYKKDLIQRVRGETSGDYEKLLVACLS